MGKSDKVTLAIVAVAIIALSLLLAAICTTILFVIHRRKMKRRDESPSEAEDINLQPKPGRVPYKRKVKDKDPFEKMAESSAKILQKEQLLPKEESDPMLEPVVLGDQETKTMARSLDDESALKQCVFKDCKHVEHPGCLLNTHSSKDTLGSRSTTSSASLKLAWSKFKKNESVFKFLPPKSRVKSSMSLSSESYISIPSK